MTRTRRPSAWLALATLWLSAAALHAQEDPPIAAAVRTDPAAPRAGGDLALVVRFDVSPGVHLYEHSIRLRTDSLVGLEARGIEKPVPKEIPDSFSDDPLAVTRVYEGTVEVVARFRVTAAAGAAAALAGFVEFQGCSDTVCYPPARQAFAFEFALEAGPPAARPAPPGLAPAPGPSPPPAGDVPVDLDPGFLLLKILQAFGIGLLISLTPCVYPMIGITAAIIGGAGAGEERRLARSVGYSLVYVLGLSIAYATLGVLTALAGAPFAQLLKSGWILLPVSAVFVVLALNMFDVIQIQTPSFIQNRLSGVGRGGRGAASRFALGLVSGVVATPCVAAPLIALLLEILTLSHVHGTAAAMVYGFAMLFSMAWGMGIILILAGVLTANVLPRSGAWMVWIKKLFGFGMLWAAVYFALPVIGDLAYDLLTALILFAAVVFLGGLDRLDRESGLFDRAKKAAALPVLVMAVLLFAGAVQGLTNLFPWLDCGRRPAAETPIGGFRQSTAAEVEAALASGRPVILDFNATWCQVCKKLDRETLSDPRVVKALDGVEALKVDYDEHPALVRRFGVLGVPTVVFLDAGGRERADLRFSGLLSPEAFLAKRAALSDGAP